MGKRKSGALAGKTKMSERNQVSAADAAVINAIDWDKVALQKVIHAANQRRLGGPLTKWLAEEGWNLGKFVVKENFVVDTSRRAKVKISGLGSNFRNWFLNTVENLPPVGKLDQFILPESMYDKDIVVKLGGVAKAINSMGKVSGLMIRRGACADAICQSPFFPDFTKESRTHASAKQCRHYLKRFVFWMKSTVRAKPKHQMSLIGFFVKNFNMLI